MLLEETHYFNFECENLLYKLPRCEALLDTFFSLPLSQLYSFMQLIYFKGEDVVEYVVVNFPTSSFRRANIGDIQIAQLHGKLSIIMPLIDDGGSKFMFPGTEYRLLIDCNTQTRNLRVNDTFVFNNEKKFRFEFKLESDDTLVNATAYLFMASLPPDAMNYFDRITGVKITLKNPQCLE